MLDLFGAGSLTIHASSHKDAALAPAAGFAPSVSSRIIAMAACPPAPVGVAACGGIRPSSSIAPAEAHASGFPERQSQSQFVFQCWRLALF
jgi:hypothetical protein